MCIEVSKNLKRALTSGGTITALLGACLPGGVAPCSAQTDSATSLPVSAQAPLAASPSPSAESVRDLLALGTGQVERLNRTYEAFARTRLEQEARIAAWQDEMKRVQSPLTFDEKRAARLVRDVSGAEQKIADAFVKTRAEALRILTPDQRVVLESLLVERRAVTPDKYRQILLLGISEIWQVPVDGETARALLTAPAYAARSPQTYRYYTAAYSYYGMPPYGLDSHAFGSYSFSSYGYSFGGGISLFNNLDHSGHVRIPFGGGGSIDHHYDGPVHHDGHSSRPSHTGGGHHGVGPLHSGGGHYGRN